MYIYTSLLGSPSLEHIDEHLCQHLYEHLYEHLGTIRLAPSSPACGVLACCMILKVVVFVQVFAKVFVKMFVKSVRLGVLYRCSLKCSSI